MDGYVHRVADAHSTIRRGGIFVSFFFFLSSGGWEKYSFSSPHFHVFSYASCVDLTHLLSQPNASWRKGSTIDIKRLRRGGKGLLFQELRWAVSLRNVGWATTLERLQGRKDRIDSVRQILLSALSQYSRVQTITAPSTTHCRCLGM